MWSCCSPRVGTAGLALRIPRAQSCPGIREGILAPTPLHPGLDAPLLWAGSSASPSVSRRCGCPAGPPGCPQLLELLCLSGSGNGAGTFPSCCSLLAIPHPSHSPVLPNGSAATEPITAGEGKQLNKMQCKLKLWGKKKIPGNLGKAVGEHTEQISPARGEAEVCWLWLCVASWGLFLLAGKAWSPGWGWHRSGMQWGSAQGLPRLGCSWWQGAFRMLLVVPAGL